jgi:hypothetical protein
MRPEVESHAAIEQNSAAMIRADRRDRTETCEQFDAVKPDVWWCFAAMQKTVMSADGGAQVSRTHKSD